MPGRDQLLSRSRQLRDEARAASEQARSRNATYTRRLPAAEAQIADLQQRADGLAPHFRDLYQQSQAAYLAGDGEEAKRLSLEGRAMQRDCANLNAQANQLRREMRELLAEADYLRFQADELEDEAEDLEEEATIARETAVGGFNDSGVVDDYAIDSLLDSFPKAVFSKIASVIYDPDLREKHPDSRGMIIPGQEADSIRIAPQKGASREIQEQKIERTLAHEIGHVVYDRFLTEDERADWGAMSLETRPDRLISVDAIHDDIEDFAESFAAFRENPSALERLHQGKYSFLNNIYHRIQNET